MTECFSYNKQYSITVCAIAHQYRCNLCLSSINKRFDKNGILSPERHSSNSTYWIRLVEPLNNMWFACVVYAVLLSDLINLALHQSVSQMRMPWTWLVAFLIAIAAIAASYTYIWCMDKYCYIHSVPQLFNGSSFAFTHATRKAKQ